MVGVAKNIGAINPADYSSKVLTGNASIDTAALQWAIDTALGTANPATTSRAATRPIRIPYGNWLINAPLRIHSALYFSMSGMGQGTRLTPTAPMPAVLDIDGLAYSDIGHLRIEAASLTPLIDNVISYQWTPAVARSTSTNRFTRIVIKNTKFVNGIGIANLAGSDARQIDNTEWVSVHVEGRRNVLYAPTNGEYVNAVQIGRPGSGQGNVIQHDFHSCGAALCETGFDCNNINQLNIRALRPGYLDQMVKAVGGFGIHIQGFRAEHVGRILIHTGGSSPSMMSVRDFQFDNSQSPVADGQIIRFTAAGRLLLDNGVIGSGGAIKAHVHTNTGAPQSVHVSGVAAPHATVGTSMTAGAPGFVQAAGPSTRITSDGYIETSPVNGTAVATTN
jgi:hypothetical protein